MNAPSSPGWIHPHRPIFAVAIAMAAFLSAFCPSVIRAGGVVSSLNPSNLVAAVQTGGLVTFTIDGTITLTNTLSITNHTTIDGSGHNITISGNNSNRVIYVAPGITNILQGIIVTRGRSTNGAGLYNDGGTVQIVRSVLAGNQAIGKSGVNGANGTVSSRNGGNGTPAADGFGGAIYNLGTVTIDSSVLTNNLASGGTGGNGGGGYTDSTFGGNGGNGGAGGRGWGGAIFSTGTVYIISSALAANVARGGDGGSNGLGGIAVGSGKDGTGGLGSSGQGGTIYHRGILTITNCAIFNNLAAGGLSGNAGQDVVGLTGGTALGGAIYGGGPSHLGNSTLALNQARGGQGGRGGNVNPPFSGKAGGNGGSASGGAIYSTNLAVLFHVTFGSNLVTGGVPGLGGGPAAGPTGTTGTIAGASLTRAAGTIQMAHSIMAEGTTAANVSGGLTDGGYNISSDASYTLVAGRSSRNNTNPQLLKFDNYTGMTPTMGLATNSPAIDAITNRAEPFPPYDQRGIRRPLGPLGLADIGAYEATPLFSIGGRILEGTNGVQGFILIAGGNTAQSDAAGRFVISNLPPDIYAVVPTQLGSGILPLQTNVPVGPTVTNVLFRANPPFLQVAVTNIALGTNLTLLTRSATLPVAAMPLQTYRVQYLTNLTRTNWLTLSTNTAATNGLFRATDTNVAFNPSRFYRVVRP